MAPTSQHVVSGDQARIVVGIDRSESARSALEWAGAAATARGAVLDLVHAWSWPVPLVPSELAMMSIPSPPIEEMRDAALSVITDVVTDVYGHDADGPEFIAHASEGSAAQMLLSIGADADMIVIGSRGHNSILSALVGSVSRQVAHHANVPVVIVRHSDDGPRPKASNITVGVDGSDESMAALKWAAAEAGSRGLDLRVISTWEYPTLSVASMTIGNVLPPGELMNEATQNSLSIWLENAAISDSVNVIAEVAEGSAAQVLLDAADDAEMLVVGARGSGGFPALRMGSVANRCIAHCPCPVAIIPAVS